PRRVLVDKTGEPVTNRPARRPRRPHLIAAIDRGRIMSRRRARWLAALFCAGWLGLQGWALRLGATALGTNPLQLAALLVASYLGIWGLVFLISRHPRSTRALQFVLCTASIAIALALIEAPAYVGLIDYTTVFLTPTPAWLRPENRPDPDLIFDRNGRRTARMTFVGSELYRVRGGPRPTLYRTVLRLDGHGFRNPDGLDDADVIV